MSRAVIQTTVLILRSQQCNPLRNRLHNQLIVHLLADAGEALSRLWKLSPPAPPQLPQQQTVVRPSIDNDGFVWMNEDGLAALALASKVDRSADAKYSFAQRPQDKCFKCRLCSKVYSGGSSLTTRRDHLDSDTKHYEQYIEIITKYNLPNKLSKERRKQREAGVEAERLPFTIPALTAQLVKVIVSNKLGTRLCNLITARLEVMKQSGLRQGPRDD
ncbi:hypothetical protein R3P38DRAFT_3232364 [Favolaschia claudopus]|uniref:BED-type domain-containing protein n=1 Tax=Favolaschia claudopus TaxID=2862362 RepID=A0AAV9ZJ43_9AGAR